MHVTTATIQRQDVIESCLTPVRVACPGDHLAVANVATEVVSPVYLPPSHGAALGTRL